MPPLSFRPNKSGALIASTLGEVDSAFYAEDGGVKVSSSAEIHGNRRHEACRPTQCLAKNDIKPQNFTSSVTP